MFVRDVGTAKTFSFSFELMHNDPTGLCPPQGCLFERIEYTGVYDNWSIHVWLFSSDTRGFVPELQAE